MTRSARAGCAGFKVVVVPCMVPLILAVGIVFGNVVREPSPCTSTIIVHSPGTSSTCAGMVPPVIEIVCVPAAAATMPPAHVVLVFGTGATIIPFVGVPGSGSVTDTFTNGETFVFRNVIVSVEVPPGLATGGVNDFLAEISLTVETVRSAVRLLGIVRFSLFVISVGKIVFVWTPGVLLVT